MGFRGFLLGKVERGKSEGVKRWEGTGWEGTPRPTFPISQRLPFLKVVDYSLEILDSSSLLSMINLKSRLINLYLPYQPRLMSGLFYRNLDSVLVVLHRSVRPPRGKKKGTR